MHLLSRYGDPIRNLTDRPQPSGAQLLIRTMVLVLEWMLPLMLDPSSGGCRRSRWIWGSVSRRGAPALQWSLIGTRHVEITTIVTPVGVRGVRVTFDAALVAKVA